MPLEGQSDKIYVGREFSVIHHCPLQKDDLIALLSDARSDNLECIALPIDSLDDEFERRLDIKSFNDLIANDTIVKQWLDEKANQKYKLNPTIESDLIVPSHTWHNAIIMSMSKWIILDDERSAFSEVYSVATPKDTLKYNRFQFCQSAFQQQLSWASHCGVYATILPTPFISSSNRTILCPNYISVLSRFLAGQIATQLWIRIPLIITSHLNGVVQYIDGWHLWQRIRKSIKSSIGVALELTPDVPIDIETLNRWIAEPIKLVIIPSSLFKLTTNGNYVLTKTIRTFLMTLMKHSVQILIQYNSKKFVTPDLLLEDAVEKMGQQQQSKRTRGPTMFQLWHSISVLNSSLPPRSEADLFCQPYWDFLQCPLQPLRDNLESQTYETFEKDPIKYSQYEKAILFCLTDRIEKELNRHVIMVVGAGRGPLVAASLRALSRANIKESDYRVIAVEKNENAVMTLNSRVRRDEDVKWRDVEIISMDMRDYTPHENADIIVSELLGSFGDNELSPECLDGAQRFLSKTGVSIPYRYWSSWEPVSTPKLWNECHNHSSGQGNSSQKSLETAYVVHFHDAYLFSKEGAQKCFEYSHPCPIPIKADNSHNNRYVEMTFTSKVDAVCHGFAGYFHCDLYQDISISIHPPTYSEGMFSWFPLYLPIKIPMTINRDETLRCHLWRLSNSSQIWYEWSISEPHHTEIHNIEGRSYAILR